MALFKKTSPRRNQVRRNIGTERSLRLSRLADADAVVSLLLWLVFIALCVAVLSFRIVQQGQYMTLAALAVLTVLLAVGAGFYVSHYQPRLVRNHARAVALVVIFVVLLMVAKLGSLSSSDARWGPSWGTGTAVLTAIILVIAYDQRFALGVSALYCVFAVLAVGPWPDSGFRLQGIGLFLTMFSGAAVCCLSL